jgi:hypothetical protein
MNLFDMKRIHNLMRIQIMKLIKKKIHLVLPSIELDNLISNLEASN